MFCGYLVFFLKAPASHDEGADLRASFIINFVQEMDYHYRDASFMFIFMYS